ncbi:hypothetical protein CEXT_442401 [Caerostris extrusa]|uniref:Uncharacterized protein n=1 Tax=Caerostris extrusa TaxID=172846 RepID=A0AAV4WWM9_CAEEX|nr:hypothetical protein CEXT_442401 [Caerostris extrusa]
MSFPNITADVASRTQHRKRYKLFHTTGQFNNAFLRQEEVRDVFFENHYQKAAAFKKNQNGLGDESKKAPSEQECAYLTLLYYGDELEMHALHCEREKKEKVEIQESRRRFHLIYLDVPWK